jgi:peroxiredoxin
VLYVYPRTGTPGQPLPVGWDAIPGARGCTLENCAFRDLESDVRECGARLMGLSAQSFAEQCAFAGRERLRYPLLNDSDVRLAGELGLPTFEVAGLRRYKRLTLIASRCGDQGLLPRVSTRSSSAAGTRLAAGTPDVAEGSAGGDGSAPRRKSSSPANSPRPGLIRSTWGNGGAVPKSSSGGSRFQGHHHLLGQSVLIHR